MSIKTREQAWLNDRLDHMPWLSMTDEQKAEQADWQAFLAAKSDARFGEGCFVSPNAHVYADRLRMGDRSYIAANATARGPHIEMGADCTLNPFAALAGIVTLGDGVRIGTHASIFGFNHGFAEIDRPIYKQPCTHAGVRIGDDVWIGANAVIVDGVDVGAHSIIAGGAVVVKDVPPYSVVGGNPARVIRSRLGRAQAEAGIAAEHEAHGGDYREAPVRNSRSAGGEVPEATQAAVRGNGSIAGDGDGYGSSARDGSGYNGSARDGDGYGSIVGDGSGYNGSARDGDGYNSSARDVGGYGSSVRDGSGYNGSAGEDARTMMQGGESSAAVQGKRGDHADRGALSERLRRFGAAAAAQLPELLSRCLSGEGGEAHYRNQPGSARTVRAWCDAVEIAAMFGVLPPGFSREQLAAKLQSFQDPETGLLPDPWKLPDPQTNAPARMSDSLSRYHILAVGYALETLEAAFPHPISVIENMTAETLYRNLNELPWETNAWGCGDWIDAYATGLYFNRKQFGSRQTPDALFGWLLLHADRYSGMWGKPTANEQWLQPVNGFYRLTRATYAQFGVPLPYPQAAIDTVLAHSRNAAFFRADSGNACNVLDVIHPLWLCLKQTGYRRPEIERWAEAQIDRTLSRWIPGQGFSFSLEQTDAAGLQGTEMWLSILYLLADVCGLSGQLGYKPKGVHRVEVPMPAIG